MKLRGFHMRRILLLTGTESMCQKGTHEVSFSEINEFTSIYTYYFRKVLEELGGYEVHVFPLGSDSDTESYFEDIDFPEVDHTIAMLNRAFVLRPQILFEKVRTVTNGLVCVLGDTDEIIGPEDVIFHARESVHEEIPSQSRWIGWGSDQTVFYPEKDERILSVFVDMYPILPKERKDVITEEVFLDTLERLPGKIKQYGFDEVRIRTIGKEGLVTINTLEEVREVIDEETRRISYSELSEEMRATDIFVAGHSESMGLSILEAAMSGSYLAIPIVWGKPFIKPDLVGDLHHKYFQVGDEPATIPWDYILSELDIEKSASMASEKTWENVVSRVIEVLY